MKPHLSPSQLNAYCRCPEAYRRRYIEGEKIPPAVAMMQGTAIHGAAKVNFTQKLESHKDLKLSDIKDVAVSEFDAAVAGGYYLSPDEESRGAKIVIDEAKDATARLATIHAQEQAPDYQPVMVESRFRIELPMCSRDLVGIVDLADEKDRVTDFKTAARVKQQTEADTSIQLTTYAAGFRALTGRDVSETRLDTAVLTKSKKASRQVLSSNRTAVDYEKLANRINAVLKAIESGNFPPTVPGVWWCSVRFCGYARTCPYYNPAHERGEPNGE